MKNIFIIICGLFFLLAHSQEKKAYIFYVELNHYSNAPKFEKQGDLYVYVGKEQEEKDFFSKYSVLDFFQAFPDSRRERTLNMFLVATWDKNLMSDMTERFPNKYLEGHDVSNIKVELLDNYTNDYGTTIPSSSPIVNVGIPESLSNFDYIGVPKAWDYTYGDSNILIGISDTGVDEDDIEFKFKTSYIPGFVNSSTLSGASHGNTVTAIAAAQGNNRHGTVGVCSDCGIVEAIYTYGSPEDSYGNPTPDFNRLLLLAKAGVKVINMSWRYTSDFLGYQWVIDEIYEDYNVVLVAGAGNENGGDPNYFTYPASYNHVISVSAVNHKNETFYDEIVSTSAGDISRYVADQIDPSIHVNPDGTYTHSAVSHITHNKDVDICAPGFYIFLYTRYVLGDTVYYNEGHTSPTVPHVSGTVGLMYSVNECLINDEVEDIIQLTSKNLEAIYGNEPWAGLIGAGKLETGDAVEFTDEMKQANGNALIDGQDFYRFDFNLAHINNKLTISNQIFRDKCRADFTARNEIEVLPGSDFNPDEYGYVDLKVSDTISIGCDSGRPAMAQKRIAEEKNQQTIAMATTKLYPNPNNGTFEITFAKVINNSLQVEVYDIYGKVVYTGTEKTADFSISIPNLSAGIYIVKLSTDGYTETIKFIKQ